MGHGVASKRAYDRLSILNATIEHRVYKLGKLDEVYVDELVRVGV